MRRRLREAMVRSHRNRTEERIMDARITRTSRNRARALAAAATATLALGLAACGGGDDTSTSADTSTGATSVTASDFIIQVEDEKQATIESVVAANPECDGVDTDRDFLLLVSAQATDLKPDEPIEPLIVDNCTP
jgi:hypothetical protein